jgi:predicted nucleic acid-binding protein
MIYYALTAEDPEGKRLPESSGQWQPPRTHFENIAATAVALGLTVATRNIRRFPLIEGLLVEDWFSL